MRVKRPSKRIIIVSITLLTVGLVSLYAWQSVGAWSSYEERLISEKRSYENLKSQALKADSPEARLKAVRELDDRVAVRAKFCQINNLYAWQVTVVPVLRDGVNACKAAVKQLDTLASPLKELRQYLDSAREVQSVVAGLAPAGTINEQNWDEKGLARAKQVQKNAQELKGSGDSAKLNDQTKQLTSTLVKEWEALISANASKDKQAYLIASEGVMKAYADFSGLADTTDGVIQQKVDAVVKASL